MFGLWKKREKKKEKIEKEMATSGPPPEGGLRVSIKIYWRFDLPGIFENSSSNPFNNFLQKMIIKEMWI